MIQNRKISVYLVEDYQLIRKSLKLMISKAPDIEITGDFETAEDFFEAFEQTPSDVVIMDLGLPMEDGVDAIKKIRKNNNDVKIIVLTSHSEKDEVISCLKAGISAYCTKDIKPEKLCDIIFDVLSGSMYFDAAVSKYVLESNSEKKETILGNISLKDCYNLTHQEKRVLILLASGNNNQQIAKKLSISINTTKVHVCSILQKMGVEDRTQAAIKAIRENLIN